MSESESEYFEVFHEEALVYTSPIFMSNDRTIFRKCLPSIGDIFLYEIYLRPKKAERCWSSRSSLTIWGPYGNVLIQEHGTKQCSYSIYVGYSLSKDQIWDGNRGTEIAGWKDKEFSDKRFKSFRPTEGLFGEPFHATFYLRRLFTFQTDGAAVEMNFYFQHGIVVYINGVEVMREHMPLDGKITPETESVGSFKTMTHASYIFNGDVITDSNPVIAIELHYPRDFNSPTKFDAWIAEYLPTVKSPYCYSVGSDRMSFPDDDDDVSESTNDENSNRLRNAFDLDVNTKYQSYGSLNVSFTFTQNTKVYVNRIAFYYPFLADDLPRNMDMYVWLDSYGGGWFRVSSNFRLPYLESGYGYFEIVKPRFASSFSLTFSSAFPNSTVAMYEYRSLVCTTTKKSELGYHIPELFLDSSSMYRLNMFPNCGHTSSVMTSRAATITLTRKGDSVELIPPFIGLEACHMPSPPVGLYLSSTSPCVIEGSVSATPGQYTVVIYHSVESQIGNIVLSPFELKVIVVECLEQKIVVTRTFGNNAMNENYELWNYNYNPFLLYDHAENNTDTLLARSTPYQPVNKVCKMLICAKDMYFMIKMGSNNGGAWSSGSLIEIQLMANEYNLFSLVKDRFDPTAGAYRDIFFTINLALFYISGSEDESKDFPYESPLVSSQIVHNAFRNQFSSTVDFADDSCDYASSTPGPTSHKREMYFFSLTPEKLLSVAAIEMYVKKPGYKLCFFTVNDFETIMDFENIYTNSNQWARFYYQVMYPGEQVGDHKNKNKNGKTRRDPELYLENWLSFYFYPPLVYDEMGNPEPSSSSVIVRLKTYHEMLYTPLTGDMNCKITDPETSYSVSCDRDSSTPLILKSEFVSIDLWYGVNSAVWVSRIGLFFDKTSSAFAVPTQFDIYGKCTNKDKWVLIETVSGMQSLDHNPFKSISFKALIPYAGYSLRNFKREGYLDVSVYGISMYGDILMDSMGLPEPLPDEPVVNYQYIVTGYTFWIQNVFQFHYSTYNYGFITHELPGEFALDKSQGIIAGNTVDEFSLYLVAKHTSMGFNVDTQLVLMSQRCVEPNIAVGIETFKESNVFWLRFDLVQLNGEYHESIEFGKETHRRMRFTRCLPQGQYSITPTHPENGGDYYVKTRVWGIVHIGVLDSDMNTIYTLIQHHFDVSHPSPAFFDLYHVVGATTMWEVATKVPHSDWTMPAAHQMRILLASEEEVSVVGVVELLPDMSIWSSIAPLPIELPILEVPTKLTYCRLQVHTYVMFSAAIIQLRALYDLSVYLNGIEIAHLEPTPSMKDTRIVGSLLLCPPHRRAGTHKDTYHSIIGLAMDAPYTQESVLLSLHVRVMFVGTAPTMVCPPLTVEPELAMDVIGCGFSLTPFLWNRDLHPSITWSSSQPMYFNKVVVDLTSSYTCPASLQISTELSYEKQWTKHAVSSVAYERTSNILQHYVFNVSLMPNATIKYRLQFDPPCLLRTVIINRIRLIHEPVQNFKYDVCHLPFRGYNVPIGLSVMNSCSSGLAGYISQQCLKASGVTPQTNGVEHYYIGELQTAQKHCSRKSPSFLKYEFPESVFALGIRLNVTSPQMDQSVSNIMVVPPLPSGMDFNEKWEVSGTPMEEKSSLFTFYAWNEGGAAKYSINLNFVAVFCEADGPWPITIANMKEREELTCSSKNRKIGYRYRSCFSVGLAGIWGDDINRCYSMDLITLGLVVCSMTAAIVVFQVWRIVSEKLKAKRQAQKRKSSMKQST